MDGKTFKVISCNDTATITGASNGVIRLFEKYSQHQLQAVVCLLYLNELPLRQMMGALGCSFDKP